MVRIPFIGSGRTVEGNAELVTRKQDFNAHIEGGGFRHQASTIDIQPISHVTSTDLQGALTEMNANMVGINYITIGDGVHSVGDFTVSETVTINNCFTSAFASPQLAAGGCILMKPGVYVFNDKVDLPVGISVIGSGSATILSAGSGLTIGSRPIFTAPRTPNMIMYKPLSGSKEWNSDGYNTTVFSDLTFVDNYVATYSSSPNSPPHLTGVNSAFIQITNDSKVSVRNCTVIGKAVPNRYTLNTLITNSFITVHDATPGSSAFLEVKNCIIHGVQKAVSFIVSSTTSDNKLKVIDNRIWCFSKVTSGNDYAVEFSACDAQLNGNTIKFETMVYDNDVPATLTEYCFHSIGTPASPINITVNNNILANSSTNKTLSSQLIYFDSGSNQICSASNNSTGGTSDNWNITIGDGIASVGDLNGSDALNLLSNLFPSNIAAYRTGNNSNAADQLTVFIHPGNYTINNTFNIAGLGCKLIGLKENGTLPQITITNPTTPSSLTGWSVDTANYIILGTHLENLTFACATINYRIVCPVYYADNGVDISNKLIVRNCIFNNVGITPINIANTVNTSSILRPQITFDHCILSNTLSDSWAMIVLAGGQADYFITNCNTNNDFKGYPISNSTLDYKANLTIKDCNFIINELPSITTNVINIPGFYNLTLTNTTIDISQTTANYVSLCDVSFALNTEINGCKFVGNNSDCRLLTYVDGEGATQIQNIRGLGVLANCSQNIIGKTVIKSSKIANNSFTGVLTAIYNAIDNSDNNAYQIIIKENNHIFASKTTAFLVVTNTTSNTPYNLLASNNIVDCSNSSINEMQHLVTLHTQSVIHCYNFNGDSNTPQSNAIIENNKLYNIATSTTATKPQCAIGVYGFHSSKIKDNTINMSKTVANVDGYVISCQMVGQTLGGDYITDLNSFTHITGNAITYDNTTLGSNIICPIYVRNIHISTIKDNTVISNTNITNYIRAFSNPQYSDKINGVIENNIFSTTLKYTSTWIGEERVAIIESKEVLAHDESLIGDSLIRSLNNKNQKAKYDISCTQFKQYGFNTTAPGCALLLSDATIIQSGATANNLNKCASRIGLQYAGGEGQYAGGQGNLEIKTGSWNDLPSGLYYTNHWKTSSIYNANDPMCETTNANQAVGHNQNQILIPLNDLPRDCEILNIDIPVYLYNFGVSDCIVNLSCSWIFGNSIEDSGVNRYYMTEDTRNASWGITSINPLYSSGTKKVLMNYNRFNTADPITTPSANTNSSWLADAATKLISSPDMYILLSINRVINADEATHKLAFAIPYARITIRY